jgi:glycosyltransferase involved in cell wall biosynthesis
MVDPSRRVPAYDRDLAAALRRRGRQVTLLTAPALFYDPGGSGADERIAFGRLFQTPGGAAVARLWPLARRAGRALEYPVDAAAAARWLAARRVRLVHQQWSLLPAVDLWFWRRLRRAGCRIVFTAHNVLPHEPRPWHRALFRRLYRAADRVIVHSASSRARLAAMAPEAADRTIVVPMAGHAGPAIARGEARARLGLPREARITLFFGHRRPYKGLEVLLDAHRRRANGRDLLLIAGPGPEPAATGPAVEIRAGYVSEDHKPWYLAAADVVALPYLATDDSAVLADALASGRAVVASDVGGLADALAPAGGSLVPPGDPAALAAALTAVLSAPDRQRDAEARAAAAAARWRWDDVAAATDAVYAGLSADGHRGATGAAGDGRS